MIEPKELREVSSALRKNFQTAMGAVEKNNVDYAIMLLKGIVQKEPGFLDAREQLRKMERKKNEQSGFFAKFMSGIKAGSRATKGAALLKAGKAEQAMREAEEALAISITNIPALNLLAKAAQELEANFIVVEALELAAEFHPKNEAVLDWLATVYAQIGEGKKVLQIRQQIASMHPGDMQKQQDVRAAAALATIERGNLDQDDFRKSLKDQDQSIQAEQDEKIVRDIDDVRNLIDEYEKRIAEGDESLDLHRKLAEMYQRGGDHENALKYFNIVVEKMGTLDPHIDQAIEKSKIAQWKEAIEEWKAYGEADESKKAEADENIANITAQMNDYRLERALDRVRLYPNDTELRYALATVYWEMGKVDEALKEFQIAQKNPHRRLTSLVYLGRCFFEKGQYDIAVEQFEAAIEGMHAMNKEKMDALYHLAITYEAMEQKDKAAATFKQIYQANVSFRDVAERMESLYKK